MANGKPCDILLVEDNQADVRLVMEAFKEGDWFPQVRVTENGEQAMDFLHGRAPFGDRSLPKLILLDLNLPKKDGREVLQEIKSDPDLRRIPVVILSTSNAEGDILSAYDHHANCYITKPMDLDQFMDSIQGIRNFWFSLVRLP